jgi:ABC-type hemin transport system substrate-binding protein
MKRAALLFLPLALLLACERNPFSPPAEKADSTAQQGATTQPSATAPARAALSELTLHNWVLNPPIDPQEAEAKKLRIVSGAPNISEICCALGLRDQLVGRTRYCVYPPDVASVPSIGALVDTQVETLLELHPDLVLVAGRSQAMTDRFAQLNVRFEPVPDVALNDLFVAIRRIAALTHRPHTAERLCAGIEADLDEVTRRLRGVPSQTVLLLIGTLADPPGPPFVAGPGSF